ncbi:hypothetical protein [uncultured Tateyamaria sp.]|uniref:hypothetical protein n=1 Tax=Tateyamaria sp. 1078 TaxID=3417464 RepID=UPI0026201729|nr:hypothetical protein [uncultured Tateyamaria sp.]
MRTSIKHIDACVALFDPNAKPPATYHDGLIPRHTAPKGHLKRFILTQLREASEPLSARQIANAWVIDQTIEGDADTLRLLRKRIGIAINTIKKDGLVIEAGMDGVSKLWTLKKGGL